jgi:hypothetical protein
LAETFAALKITFPRHPCVLLIPLEIAPDSEMKSPTIPI